MTVRAASGNGLNIISGATVAEGFQIRFDGMRGRTSQILRATAFNGPWSSTGTAHVPSNDIGEFVDTASPGGSAFYRTATP